MAALQLHIRTKGSVPPTPAGPSRRSSFAMQNIPSCAARYGRQYPGKAACMKSTAKGEQACLRELQPDTKSRGWQAFFLQKSGAHPGKPCYIRLFGVFSVLANTQKRGIFEAFSQGKRCREKRRSPANRCVCWTFWRRGWDSNPCALARKLISSLTPSWFFRARRGRNRYFRKRGKARYIKAFRTFRPEMTRK